MRGRFEEVNTNLRELVLTQCGCHVEYFKESSAKLAALWYLSYLLYTIT